MRVPTVARTAAGTSIAVVARVLAVGARATEQLAHAVRGGGSRGSRGADRARGAETARTSSGEQAAVPARTDGRARAAERGAGRGVPGPGAVRQPPTEPVPDVPAHTRTHETLAGELAARTASEVIAAIPRLSTGELASLYEHELATKRRKTVLEAIERSAAPQPTATGPPEQGQ